MPQGNLAASCLIRPQPGEGWAAELGFVAALALHDVVAGFVETSRLQLKWPNDLLLDEAKLSGILLEREADVIILGIGVNLAVAPVLPDRRTIALAEVGIEISAPGFANLLAEAFGRRREMWRKHSFHPIRSDWLERAHPFGTRLLVTSGEGKIAGSFAGLDTDGALLLDGDDGKAHRIHAGDVWQPGPATGAEPVGGKEKG